MAPSTFNALRASLEHLTARELYLLKEEIDLRLQKSSVDWLDVEYMEEAFQEKDDNVSLESVRAALAVISGSMSDIIISERKDRF